MTTRDPTALDTHALARTEYPNELKDFHTLDGAIPDNLRVIRFEHLVGDLMDALRSIGLDGRPADFPWVNRSRQDDFLSYYTPRAEEAVYHRYAWVFDQGFYPRLDASPRASMAGFGSQVDERVGANETGTFGQSEHTMPGVLTSSYAP